MARRDDSSWRSDFSSGRRRGLVGASRWTRSNVVLILAINALISLCISIVVFFVLSSLFGYRGAPTPSEQVVVSTPTVAIGAATVDVSVTSLAVEGGSGQELPDVYVVRSGDNLSLIATQFGVSMEELMAANGIENPNWIGVGQKLVIPRHGAPTPTSTVPPIPTVTETPLPFDPPTPVSTPSPTSTGAARQTVTPPTPTTIAEVTETPSSLGQAIFIDAVRGQGELAVEEVIITNRGAVVDLAGWALDDGAGNVFTFPSVVLWSDARLHIHSGRGTDTPTDLYWNRAEPVWGDADKIVVLKNDEGAIITTFELQ